MKAQKLLDETLPILYTVKEDKVKLQKILSFFEEEIFEEVDETEIPEKFKNLITQIAQSIDAGFICYLNTDTLETEDIPKDLIESPEEFEALTEEDFESFNYKSDDWEHVLKFDPLNSNEAFQVMEYFARSISDTKFQEKLNNALNRRKPFANFKYIIDNSKYRQDWFDFKQRWLEKQAYNQLECEFIFDDNSDNSEEIKRIDNDGWTKIDLNTIPIPELCVICKNYQIDVWNENIQCNLTRADQKDGTNFKRYAFSHI